MSSQFLLKPNEYIGILGGGQLGRMLSLAAARLGIKTHIFCPDKESPAFNVAASATVAEYNDEVELERFGKSVRVVTYEFENVPVETVKYLEKFTNVRPGTKPLKISQDRFLEKEFLAGLKIPVAPYANINQLEDLSSAIEYLKLPAILKSRRFGYDGKGQVVINDTSNLLQKWQSIGEVPAVLERKLDFVAECSVIIARGANEFVQPYDLAENVHQNNILKTSTVPLKCLNQSECKKAIEIASKICQELNYVGVLGVELFVIDNVGEKKLVVNEIAPRVHNSGHWTEDACQVSQFEQHIRAVAGWPLGTTTRYADIEMENLIGDEVLSWKDIAASSNSRLHLYGKHQIKPGRKMGHVNRIIK